MVKRTLSPEQTARLKRIRFLARLMDDSFVIPGTTQRFGVDGFLGLVPVVGDIATGLVAAYIVREAAQLGVPRRILARMLWNVSVDLVVGAIPLAGDVFDVLWKANRKNVALLEKYLQAQGVINEEPFIEV
jgi:hypothetical protein